MSSAIDPTKPTAGTATTKSVRDNFSAAKDEIEALQTDVITAQSTADAAASTAASAAMTAMTTLYPVGAIYISTLTTNPNTLLGFGTWSSFGAGRVLVSQDTGQAEFDTIEETGGAKTVTLTSAEMPSHTHTQNSHNHTQDAHTHTQDAHTHTQNSHNHTQDAHNHIETYAGAGIGGTAQIDPSTLNRVGTANSLNSTTLTTATNQAATATNQNTTATNQNSTATNQAATATNNNTGGGGAHENLQPYIVVKMWKRTA